MILGVCYNVFDCEELLETSILSVREEVDHICVVYQTISNFGEPANPHLVDFLNDLELKGLVDQLIYYQPKSWTEAEKIQLVSKNSQYKDLGCDVSQVGDQFFNEITKRELGRLNCLENGMTHFISMDCDEFYLKSELAYAKQKMINNGYESSACRMRIFGKFPTVEYLRDDYNAVPFIHILSPTKPYRLASPYPEQENKRMIGLDPTRRIENIDHTMKFYFFSRQEIEMYHMTLVRKNIYKKLINVSNRQNYGDIELFLEKWNSWTPDQGVLHPHPFIKYHFQKIEIVPNYFNIDLNNQCRICCKSREKLMRCSVCKTAKYCSESCQREDWNKHKNECKPLQNNV